MHASVLDFVADAIPADAVTGKRVLEVGSYDVNGTVRPTIAALDPAEYIGVDMIAGPGVDRVVPAERLIETFGTESFDVIVSTEMLEHAEDWLAVVHNWKMVLRPAGWLVVTTRSPGFELHGYPTDVWRFTVDDMREIFSDWVVERLEPDPQFCGVFLVARRPNHWVEANLLGLRVYSIARRRRVLRVGWADRVWVRAALGVKRRLPWSVTSRVEYYGRMLGRRVRGDR